MEQEPGAPPEEGRPEGYARTLLGYCRAGGEETQTGTEEAFHGFHRETRNPATDRRDGVVAVIGHGARRRGSPWERPSWGGHPSGGGGHATPGG
jgi:hypothetical protein